MVNVLVTEGLAAQRVIIEMLNKSDYLNKLRVYATHSSERLDVSKYAYKSLITGQSDVVAEHLEICEDLIIDVLIVCQDFELYEPHRDKFEALGVTITCGAMGLENLRTMSSPLEFAKRCTEVGLDAVPMQVFKTADEFDALYSQASALTPVVAVRNIDANVPSFLKIDPAASHLDSISIQNLSNPTIFKLAYSEAAHKPTYLFMPFYPGVICEVDVACCNGEYVSAVARTIQSDGSQLLETESPCIELAKKLVNQFKCDGLVGVKFVQDMQGKWVVLDLKPHALEGIALSFCSGVNLVGVLVDHILKAKNISVFIRGKMWETKSLMVKPVVVGISLDRKG